MADEPMGLGQVGDDPITSAKADRLDRHAFSVRSADLIRTVADSSPSLVAGLIGPWGSGKTSALAMIAEEIDMDERWTIVKFNPWELSDLASLIGEFLTTLRSAMGRNRRARKAISKYASKIAPFAGLVPGVGNVGSNVLKAAGEQILGDTSLEAQREKLVDALRKSDQKILVLIDDVDRLQGDELTMVLKLVRLVGRLPNISYVLAYDETTLLDVLRNTDVGGRHRHRALAYLDKIVQLRLDLPPVSTYRIRAMVNKGIDDITAKRHVVLGESDLERLGAIYVDCLEPSLVEPRHIKRFFGQVEAVYDLVAGEVDFVDFLLITFVRVFYPSVHREVVLSKADLTGTKIEIERTSDEQRITMWQQKLKEEVHGLDDQAVERVMGILGVLFRRLQKYGSAHQSARSIGSAEYFDRYMYLAIPPDDYPDAKVTAAIDEITRGTPGPAVEELIDALGDAANPIVDKLARYEPPNTETARALLPFAARVAAATPDRTGFFAGRPARRARHWMIELLQRSSIPDPHSVLAGLLEHLPLTEIAASLAKTKDKDQPKSGLPFHLSDLGVAVGEALYAELEAAAEKLPSQLGTAVPWTVTLWEQFAGDPDTSREWFRKQVDSGCWPAEDVVAMFVTTGTYENGVEVLTEVNLTNMDHRIGIDWLLQRFTPVATGSLIGPFNETRATGFDERRRWAHEALAQEAVRRKALGDEPDG